MGIKRCPSFSKRPGFPCGLRVLLLDANQAARDECEQLLKECSYEVTQCATVAEALSRLAGACSYDVLLADRPSLSNANELEALLKAAEALPCVFMASQASPEDVLAGVELGAVDFLSKPLAPAKLRNIWQHTVRKMMCNMNINCSDSAAAAAVDEVAAALGKPRVSMEVILEESEEDLALAAAAAVGKPPAPTSPSSATTPCSGGGSVINYSNGPNMALAITSSFYGPSKGATNAAGAAGGSGSSLSRCGSSAMTSSSFEMIMSGSASPDSPVMDRPSKQQHGHHGPVRSCPSTRSLSSAGSCYSSWSNLGLPSSPSSDTLQKQDGSAAAGATDCDSMMGEDAAAPSKRCMKKAIRHPAPASAGVAAMAVGTPSKPPLAGKPASQQAPAQQQQQQKPAAGFPAPPAAAQGAIKAAGFPSGMPSVPLPTGLGPLPQGMVWGMPMCPLVRAPGIVPPAGSVPAQAAAGMPAGMPMSPWGMCGMPTMYGGMPAAHHPGFMAGGYSMGAMYAAAPAAAGYGSYMADPYGQQQQMQSAAFAQQQMWGQEQQHMQQQQQLNKGSCAVGAPTGAAVAAALDASFSAAELLGSGSGGSSAAAAVTMEDDAFDFVLGDIAAEDDITDVCGGLLDGLAPDSINMPVDLSSEMLALQADLQQQAAAAAAAAAGRCSFESSAAQRSRVSFDCSTASTCTAARASFEAAHRCNSNRASFEVSTRCNSNRVSFEVNCHNTVKAAAAAAAAATAGPARMGSCAMPAGATPAAELSNAKSAPAELLGSVSDFLAGCSGDSSQGSGLPHVDSCGMLADLQSFFAASGDSSCPQDCADSALTDSSGLFLDPLDDMPIVGGMRKNDSFAELINATLPGLAN